MPARPGFERDWHFDRDAIISGASFSGHERNKLFLNVAGSRFEDVSGVSGLDAETDGRAFAVFDYDRDGWQDIAIVNANAPLLELFRNRVGSDSDRPAAENQIVALRFVGSNREAVASPGRSNRDGIGTLVKLRVGDQTLQREVRGGEGFASQNSATMIIGIGKHDLADEVVVRWPSGVVQTLTDVPSGSLLTLYEDAAHSPNGESAVSEPYRKAVLTIAAAERPKINLPRRVFPLHAGLSHSGIQPRLVIYTTMATWCASCLGELPQWQKLTELFSPEQLEIRAVPVDNGDTAAMLERYVKRHRPVYRMLETDSSEVASVNQLVIDEMGKDGLPASFVTDARGQVVDSDWGAPSVSLIRRLLWEQGGAPSQERLAATH